MPKRDIDDETLPAQGASLDADDVDTHDDLPQPSSLLKRAADESLKPRTGLERRFFEIADGVTPLHAIAQVLGVNVLRAQHLARQLIREGRLAGELDDFDVDV